MSPRIPKPIVAMSNPLNVLLSDVYKPEVARRMAESAMRLTLKHRDIIIAITKVTRRRALTPKEYNILSEIVVRGMVAPRMLWAVIHKYDFDAEARAHGLRRRRQSVVEDVERTRRKRPTWDMARVYQDVAARHDHHEGGGTMNWSAVKKLHQRAQQKVGKSARRKAAS